MVGALASKADAAGTHERAVAVKEQVGRFAGRIRDTAAHVGRLVEDKTPAPVRAGLVSARGQAGQAAARGRTRRTAWIGAAGVLTAAALLVRRTRRARRARGQR